MSESEHPFKSPNFIQSLRHAVRGLVSVAQSERNFRTHLLLCVFVLSAGLYFRVSQVEWITLIFCMTLMMAVETLNTAIEHLIDLCVGSTYSEKAGHIKDISAGACLLTAIGVGIIGAIVFISHLF